MAFAGWPEQALDLLELAGVDQTATGMAARRADHERFVRQPMVELVEEVGGEFGDPYVWHLHRNPHWWMHQVAEVGVAGRVGLGVMLSLDGLLVWGGFAQPSPALLAAYRAAVDGPDGVQLQRGVARLDRGGWRIGGDLLATRPRGVAPDHPRLDLLRQRTLRIERSWPMGPWLAGRQPVQRVRTAWRALTPVTSWLAARLPPR